jgi:hypothetical protein
MQFLNITCMDRRPLGLNDVATRPRLGPYSVKGDIEGS